MTKFLKIFVWILAVAALLAAGLVLYLRYTDLGVYQDQIEAYLSETIGHEVRVEGALELSVGNLTRLTAEKITISNNNRLPEAELLSC